MAASEDRTRVLYEILAMIRGVGGRMGELNAIDDLLRRAMVEFPRGHPLPLPARVRYVLERSESEESEEERSDPKRKGKVTAQTEERRREERKKTKKAARGNGRKSGFAGVFPLSLRQARSAEIADELFPPPLNLVGLIRFPPKEEDDPMARAATGGADGSEEVASSEVAKEASPVAGPSGTRKTPTPEPTNEDVRRLPSEAREEAPTRMEVDGGAPTELEVTAGDVEMGGVVPEIGGGALTASEVEKGRDEEETEPFGPGGGDVVAPQALAVVEAPLAIFSSCADAYERDDGEVPANAAAPNPKADSASRHPGDRSKTLSSRSQSSGRVNGRNWAQRLVASATATQTETRLPGKLATEIGDVYPESGHRDADAIGNGSRDANASASESANASANDGSSFHFARRYAFVESKTDDGPAIWIDVLSGSAT
ncbi:hypothetical protein C8R47DRAFT_1214834 [Mycena vitilis]|nr:hypothetical protein C8R47DRAFT_1214834 [Mycena vitilis]